MSNYLLYLMHNKTAYAEYFWWKDFYTVEETDTACNLCEQLTKIKEMEEKHEEQLSKEEKKNLLKF